MVTGIPFACIFHIALLHLWSNSGVAALPHGLRSTEGTSRRTDVGYDIPIMTKKARSTGSRNRRRGNASGSVGLGNNVDLLYTVPIEVGNNVFAVNLDTGSSDLWVVSDTCRRGACSGARTARYPQSSVPSGGANVNMTYGDSTTGTFASGAVGLDTATIAGVSMNQQAFGVVNDTSNFLVQFEAAGIFGLSFPAASRVQQAVVTRNSGPIDTTDKFIESTYTSGPLLPRIAMSGALELPMFTVQFQRNTIDVGGEGLLTLGKLPDGVDNSSLTWVPVRPYSVAEGGMDPPSWAPNEVYLVRQSLKS
ncbi:hypothetical protein NLJ89_g11508 [Agrocybe chaxingu]|uniref:Peptidase A1 domain-containing protein n=1 Tax=Agrocybe chaxingu TaxID=84603 RepID=A0A9W8JNL1_9AGAR|nr:hypothetical protein NLJ89_g11508 [Agrocybe chaxingu]